MARDKELLYQRNLKVHERFRYHRKKNPKWKLNYVIDEVAKEMFITPLTVMRILKQPLAKPVPTQQMMLSFSPEC